eukprot:TRINITY_DN50839_c0_g1_i1.p1 TRINITY_DN50839_c0_g1~~TRINITY_DN50839_c0_g1_i1.p1  ORF type:complete len:395 (-),score=74.67 TRINITY_DN50839_c0_g1_i1:213-1397(-)
MCIRDSVSSDAPIPPHHDAADKGVLHGPMVEGLPVSVHGLYREDLAYNPECHEESIHQLVRALVPAAEHLPATDFQISVVVGGITNALFKVSMGSEAPVLIRVFGAEGMIDRDVENATCAALADANIAPPYYGRFQNGRIEGFLEGTRPMELEDLARPDLSAKVAVQLANLHNFQVPAVLEHCHSVPGLWDQIWLWLSQAERDISQLKNKCGAAAANRFREVEPALLGQHFTKAREELEELQQRCTTGGAALCFCHNDALAGNILVNEETQQVHLIDFEYGGCNYRGFDIANHWNEWAGGTQVEMNGQCEYGRFPDKEQQLDFCKAYSTALVGDGSLGVEIMEDACRFVGINHWYWGLWALNQAVLEGIQQFDYLQYFCSRLGQYYELKERGMQ